MKYVLSLKPGQKVTDPKKVKELIEEHSDPEYEDKKNILNQLNDIDKRIPTLGENAVKTVKHIEALFATAEILPITNEIKLKALDRGINKKAPFHLSKNSTGDAIIIETYDDYKIKNQSQDFNLPERINNRAVGINIEGINNTDVWLYGLTAAGQVDTLWNQVPTVNAANIIYNNNAAKDSYQVNTRAGDQVDLVFGDGTFASIPQGTFRSYYRQSNGLAYKITPAELQNIQIPISYISRAGRMETITLTASLQYTVANATTRESLDDIKQKAPQQYYTQNRMVTGEDYNILPYTLFNDVLKIKAVNRTQAW